MNIGRRETSILELKGRNNQDLEDLLTKFGEQNTKTCTLEMLLCKEFDELVNAAVIAYCTKENDRVTLERDKRKGIISALNPT